MEDTATSTALNVATDAGPSTQMQSGDAPASPLSNAVRDAPLLAQEPVRKSSQEWASPRMQGRRGTPPPIPRRGSRSDDVTSTGDVPPRPRTPAQVLASRAQAGKAAASATTSSTNESVEPLPQPPEASTAATDTEGDSVKATEPESSPATALADVVGEEDAITKPPDAADGPERRTSLQLSVLSESDAASELEGDSFGGYRRSERGDTSTVDEESMYNDDEEEEDDDEEDEDDEDGTPNEDEGEEEGDEEDGEDHASVGTSDEYVNILRHENEFYHDDEDEQQHQRGEDSLTPDNTPPPSPVRPAQPPPPLASEWIKYVAESGHEYYYNSRTHISQWTRPPALLSPTATGSQVGEVEENQELLKDSAHHEMLAQVPVHVVAASTSYYATPVPPQAPRAATAMPSYLEALFAAVTKNDETAQLHELLRYEVDVNAVNASGLSPLHVAVQHGNARGAAMLLDYGARVDGLEEYANGMGFPAIETPLVMACRTNHATLVRLLVRYGASIYTRDVDGNTVLHIAIRCWSDEVLGCLLEMDSMSAILNLRNSDDETPLHLAARHGNANAVRALMASGASVDAEDAQGRTPLIVSIMENRVDCAQLLQLGVVDNDTLYPPTETTESVDQGLVMYDNSEEKTEAGDLEGEPAAIQQPANEAENLRVYLLQLLQHSSADAVLASTVYQFMDAVQRETMAMKDTQTETSQREDTLLHQIDSLTNYQSIANQELAEARETNDHLREQLDAKEHELNSLQAAYESISSRATMLESIARSSQDKLRRERAEHARQEEYWTQTIDSSLRENATLLQTVQALQQEGWRQQETGGEDSTSNEVYEDTFDSQVTDQQEYDHNRAYDEYGSSTTHPQDSFYSTAGAYDQPYYSQDPSVDVSSYYSADQDRASASETQTTNIDPEAEGTTISPARVDAVWNRFFENMARVSDSVPGQAQPSSSRNATLSPRQGATLPPASAVFDSVRKDNKDRLHQLLLSGISPNARDIGERGTPLHLASELGDVEAVTLLCEFGADVEIRDENGNTPLLVACSQGHFDCTKFLLQSAANQAAINSSRDTALHLAAWDGAVECVAMLLEYGVDVLAKNALGLTALANLKTRSPLRHRFEDLSKDHPMARTIVLLEEAERLEMSDEEKSEKTQPSQPVSTNRGPTAQAKSSKHDPKSKSLEKPVPNASWGRWLLGSVFGSASARTTTTESDGEESKSEFGEAASSPSSVKATGFLPDYEDLRPPPEIEAELRRKPLTSPTAESLPPPPPEIVDALEKRKLSGLLSPSLSATRFASPASKSAMKKPTPTTPTNVRSRYVDTFNSP